MTDTEKRAPVQGFSEGIPWSLHLRAYDAYCKKYGKQPALIDLEGRNCRGGFGVRELDMFVPGWREEVSEIAKLKADALRLQIELSSLHEQAHYANGVAELAIKHRVAAEAEIESLRERCGALEGALRKLAIVGHVRMASGGGTVPSGGSCKVCGAEWSKLTFNGEPIIPTPQEHHNSTCLLSASPPSPKAAGEGEQ